jgi:hypothetical protein
MGGCGTELKTKDGEPDFNRKFCGDKCLAKDKRERMQHRRAKSKKIGRCSHCGQSMKEKS